MLVGEQGKKYGLIIKNEAPKQAPIKKPAAFSLDDHEETVSEAISREASKKNRPNSLK